MAADSSPLANSLTLVLVIGAAILAFWAGSVWRNHRRLMSDLKVTVTGLRGLRKLRWVSLRTLALIAVIAVAYLILAGTLSFGGGGDAPDQPACKTPGTRTLRSLPPCPAPTQSSPR